MAELGSASLVLALVVAACAIAAGVAAGRRGRADWATVAQRAVWVTLALTREGLMVCDELSARFIAEAHPA